MLIPLRTTESPLHFPKASLTLVLFWIICEILSRCAPTTHVDFLSKIAFYPASAQWKGLLSLCFYPNLFSLFVGLLYTWVFTPKLFEKYGTWPVFFLGLSGGCLALFSFRALHPYSMAPLLAPEAFLGSLLGAFMRRDIWGTVSSLVIFRPTQAQLYEVPSYVLLFFWFFYIFIGNLFLSDSFANAPMLYWLPFVSFLWGFLIESLLGAYFAHKKTSDEISL